MSIVTLYTVPETSLIRNESTSLCVFDADGNLIADYDFCTGLRLTKSDEGMTVYVNDADLVPGSWVLLVTEQLDNEETKTTRVEGAKEGDPFSRFFTNDDPWTNCSPGDRVSRTEREERLSVCMSCPLLDRGTMACTVSGKPVLDVTTKSDTYCPEEFWGDKQAILDAIAENALAEGLVPTPQGVIIAEQDQAQFEAELDAYLEGLQ